MIFIAGVKTLSITTYVKTVQRLMGFTTYWEPESEISDFETMQNLVNDAQAGIAAAARSLMSNQVTLPVSQGQYSNGSSVYFEASSVAANSVLGDAEAIVGGDPGQSILPDVTALVLQRKTGLRGRAYAGRIFVPGIAEILNDNGRLNEDGAEAAEELAVYLGADATWNDITVHARHVRFKAPMEFVPVVDVRYVMELSTRHDRQIRGLHLAY